ncbi:MAG TPA: FHA domain-containing protein, partial [Blastocatellia bacterium]|nr:FHA domain-containing protein [Blastocatellia bacterium]
MPSDSSESAESKPAAPAADSPSAPAVPTNTVVLDAHAFDTVIDEPTGKPQKALLKILLPTGDIFDRELAGDETQIGKGPRNDIVIADPAVSTAHALIRLDGNVYTIKDTSSRNGTFVNGERVADERRLNHGDVIGMGLSKLTFRLGDYSETGTIDIDQMAASQGRATPPPLTEESLANAVAGAGLASKSDLDRIRGDGKGRRLYRALIEERITSEESLRDLMGRTFQIPVIDLKTARLDDNVIAEFPPKLAREQQVFPIAKEAD